MAFVPNDIGNLDEFCERMQRNSADLYREKSKGVERLLVALGMVFPKQKPASLSLPLAVHVPVPNPWHVGVFVENMRRGVNWMGENAQYAVMLVGSQMHEFSSPEEGRAIQQVMEKHGADVVLKQLEMTTILLLHIESPTEARCFVSKLDGREPGPWTSYTTKNDPLVSPFGTFFSHASQREP